MAARTIGSQAAAAPCVEPAHEVGHEPPDFVATGRRTVVAGTNGVAPVLTRLVSLVRHPFGCEPMDFPDERFVEPPFGVRPQLAPHEFKYGLCVAGFALVARSVGRQHLDVGGRVQHLQRFLFGNPRPLDGRRAANGARDVERVEAFPARWSSPGCHESSPRLPAIARPPARAAAHPRGRGHRNERPRTASSSLAARHPVRHCRLDCRSKQTCYRPLFHATVTPSMSRDSDRATTQEHQVPSREESLLIRTTRDKGSNLVARQAVDTQVGQGARLVSGGSCSTVRPRATTASMIGVGTPSTAPRPDHARRP